ncbi:AraC family transcriptional regulator [Bradyrhizobium sp. R2.2-H]|jgi:AraC-like DNA-binding protein|uniref:helix-turn-helix domain-containing protein n=1 Tax=unclassified Bradyrhizobium TaxID=2631580 RepID=UPI0010518B32|nr:MULTISPECIES: helix-turn-helix domain-containing protein [unclassified Bradyrhizobium]TCU65059.1 AraC family transcriptional regulator [Bradyrhizobium sp. Y-H1]TCU67044.1 AraC family transcriptional regulator [Bradyrhizobium sp. R2.2-H]
MQQIERAVPSRQSAWNTAGVRPTEQFAYYREAICQAFMNLTPEPAAATGFPASVEHVRLGNAAINRVSFPEHLVRRSAADIAASDRSCFYLNLKLGGRCRIQQDDREISLSSGQVGIFDSDRQFALLHDRGPQLRVASFWVPAEVLRERLPASFDVGAARVSDDPFVGHLIVETARTLSDGALRMSEDEGVRLFRVLIELVAVSLSRRGRAGAAESESLADATALALKRAIHRRLREPGLAVADVAEAVGISERYVHKLLARSGSSFTDYVIDHRLDGAARDLADSAMADRAIGAIAFDWGFSDLSHFTRRFKQRFGCRPRDWRAR